MNLIRSNFYTDSLMMFVQYSDTLESMLQAAEDDWLFDDKDKKDAPQADDNDSEDDFTFRMFPNFILADF